MFRWFIMGTIKKGLMLGLWFDHVFMVWSWDVSLDLDGFMAITQLG